MTDTNPFSTHNNNDNRSTRQEQIYYGGKVVGESAMVTEDDVGNEVRQTYIVSTEHCPGLDKILPKILARS